MEDDDEILADKPVGILGEVLKPGELLPDGCGLGVGGKIMKIKSFSKGCLPVVRYMDGHPHKRRKPITAALKDALDENDGERAKVLALALLERAAKDTAFLDRVLDRVEGKLVDKIASQMLGGLDLDETQAEIAPDDTLRLLTRRVRARLAQSGRETVV